MLSTPINFFIKIKSLDEMKSVIEMANKLRKANQHTVINVTVEVDLTG